MDAPLFPPATTFIMPVRVAREVNTSNTSIADLKKIPAAWVIIIKELPGIEARLNVDMLKPHLGNFSFRSLVQFGFAKPDQLDRVDIQLHALGAVK